MTPLEAKGAIIALRAWFKSQDIPDIQATLIMVALISKFLREKPNRATATAIVVEAIITCPDYEEEPSP